MSRGQHAVLFWTFLQADSGECPKEYHKELRSLGRDVNGNETRIYGSDCEEDTDGDLETDGHLCTSISTALEGIEPSVDLLGPENLQQIAAEIREIAAQLELNVVAQATQNLSRNITRSPRERWKQYLHQEVGNILAHGVGLDNLQQERVIAALTFTLVKGVCQQAPSLLRSLFNTALQYLSS